jgi:transcriptional regulator with XRE-family HTH domain
METENLSVNKVHHGHNVKRLREASHKSQIDIAEEVFLSQQTISRYESSEVIDDEMLERFAKVLKVPADLIKNMEESATTHNNLTNNDCTLTGSNQANVQTINGDFINNNPIEEIIRLCNEKVALYERMLELEKGKITQLEELLKKGEK